MTRQFRVGDRVKWTGGNARAITTGNIYTIREIIEGCVYLEDVSEEFGGWNPRMMELVEREIPVETLVKRANLGLRSLRKLMEDDSYKTKILNYNGDYISLFECFGNSLDDLIVHMEEQ